MNEKKNAYLCVGVQLKKKTQKIDFSSHFLLIKVEKNFFNSVSDKK